MNLILERVIRWKRGILIASCFLVVITGMIAYLIISRESPPGELVEREVSRLEMVVKENPNDPDKRVELALLYLEAGSLQQAISSLEMALTLNDSHQGALVVLGDIYMSMGRYDEAIKHYSRVIELNEDNPMRGISRQLESVYYQMGTAYFNLGSYQDAVNSLEEALLIDKTDADVWYTLGLSYQHLGQTEQAIESFGEAVRFVPDFKDAYHGLAQSYEKIGETNSATYAYAMISFCSGYYAEAITQLQSVIANEPDFAEAYLGLGLAYEEQGQTDKAINAYQEALRIKPALWLAQMKLKVLAPTQ